MLLVVGRKENCIMISPRQIINHSHIIKAISCVGEYQVQDVGFSFGFKNHCCKLYSLTRSHGTKTLFHLPYIMHTNFGGT